MSNPTRFPSVGWFRRLAHRMAAQTEKYKKLGVLDLTLVPRLRFANAQVEVYSITFKNYGCTAVETVPDAYTLSGAHSVIIDGEYPYWREMIENIQRHGHADLQHTLNYLTLPDWPLLLSAVDEEQGQLDIDRFYRYADSLQEFFNEAAAIETSFAEEATCASATG